MLFKFITRPYGSKICICNLCISTGPKYSRFFKLNVSSKSVSIDIVAAVPAQAGFIVVNLANTLKLPSDFV